MRTLAWFLLVSVVTAGCATVPPPEPVQEVLETDQEPEISFTWRPAGPVAGEPVAFEPRALVPEGSSVEAWSWTFGDGTRSDDGAPWHTFAAAGEHVVVVEASLDEGTRLTASTKVLVSAAEGPSTTPAKPAPHEEPPEETVAPTQVPEGMPADAHPDVVALRNRIQAAIAVGEPVSVPAYEVRTFSDIGYGAWFAGSPQTWSVVLQPSPILSPETFWQVEREHVAPPFVEVYEGHAAGDEDALVRLTLSGYWARGSIRAGDAEHLVRINFQGNVPEKEPKAAFSAAPFPSGATPATYDLDGEEPGDCPPGLAFYAPLHAEPVVEAGRSAHPAVVGRVVLDGDAEYAEDMGRDAFPLLVAMFAEVESIYDHEVAVRHQVVGVHLHNDTGRFPAPDNVNPLPALAQYWAGGPDRDMVHLVTGHDSGFAMANCIGAAGHPEGAYTFTPFPWERDYTVFHSHAWAHEFGHIYSAHHHYGNHGESELATIMIQGYTPGELPVFSTLSKSAIRGWAEGNL